MTVQERLEKVERELARANRLLGGVFICIGIGLMVWIFSSTNKMTQAARPAAEEIRARRFTLVDESGGKMSSLFLTETGPTFSMYDLNGMPRLGLGMTSVGSGLTLSNENGEMSLVICTTPLGPGLSMFDKNGIRLDLSLAKAGPGILLRDKNNQPRVGISMFENPVIRLIDENGKFRWTAQY